MNIHIYYGSLTVFTEKLPNNYDSIVDLAIRDDEKHRKLKLDDGRDDADEELPYYENVVAFSDDYPALTERTFICGTFHRATRLQSSEYGYAQRNQTRVPRCNYRTTRCSKANYWNAV